ncbi:MAG: hypothetical protein R2932_43670 [Caldilineaceae bacterium]
MILYNASDDDNLFSDTHWVPSVHIDYTPGLSVKNYIASSSAPKARITGGQISSLDIAPSMTIFLVARPQSGGAGHYQTGYHRTWDPGSGRQLPHARYWCVPERTVPSYCRHLNVQPLYRRLCTAEAVRLHPEWSPATASRPS